MDVKFINPFVQGTVEAIKKIAALDARPGKIALKESNVAAGDVSGIIGITGDATGLLAISFTEAGICKILSDLRGEPHTAADREVFALVRQVAKTLGAIAVASFEQAGMKVYASEPAVIYGKSHQIDPMPDSPGMTIPFATDQDTFFVDIAIKSKAAEASQVVVEPAPKHPIPAPVIATAPVITAAAAEVKTAAENIPAAVDRKALLLKHLTDTRAARDGVAKQLADKPFMEISQRTKYKQMIPALEAKIKRLKLDISALEMMSKVTQDQLDNPVIPVDYQHHSNNKR